MTSRIRSPHKRTRRFSDTTPDLFERQQALSVDQTATGKDRLAEPATDPELQKTIREALQKNLSPDKAPIQQNPVRQHPPDERFTGSIAPESSGEYLPARMLNEFVYCPRLFYYEHVEGVFVHSADTLRGKDLHKTVDSGKGGLAPAGEDPETIHSRSVSLGSERLAVNAKLDLVEIANGNEVRPVEYKAGSPFESETGIELWPTDRIQLGLQILLLRENGYTCSEGIIFYRGTKQRVPLPWTQDLEDWIRQQILEARKTAAGPIPSPLKDSAKCARCSLNGVCLPDETRLLQSASTPAPGSTPPRQLFASREETRALYLNTPGLHVGIKDERVIVKEAARVIDEIRINDLSHVALFGNIQITTQAVQTLCEKEIPITYFSMGGWFYGMTRGHGLKNVNTRIEQFRHAADKRSCLKLARKMVFGKIRNQRTLLMRLHSEPPAPAIVRLKNLAHSALETTSLPELLGTEGSAAALYFQHFGGMVKPQCEEGDFIPGIETPEDSEPSGPPLTFDFNGRNRRPPCDPVNAALSLAYSLLAKDCTIAAASVGLDPYVGFYHQPRCGRPALALDLMEEFRPLIAESAVLTGINNGMLRPHHFVRAGKSVALTPARRKVFFMAYEQRMGSLITHPVFDYKASYRRILEIQFRLLARFLTGEIAEYPPFLTR